jgi:hypothetical protein
MSPIRITIEVIAFLLSGVENSQWLLESFEIQRVRRIHWEKNSGVTAQKMVLYARTGVVPLSEKQWD